MRSPALGPGRAASLCQLAEAVFQKDGRGARIALTQSPSATTLVRQKTQTTAKLPTRDSRLATRSRTRTVSYPDRPTHPRVVAPLRSRSTPGVPGKAIVAPMPEAGHGQTIRVLTEDR